MVTEDNATIQFTFGLAGEEVEDEERLEFARNLLWELRGLDEVEKAERTEDLTPEVGSKPGWATLIGVLTAEVNFKNFKGFLGFLGDYLKDQPIEVSVKVGDHQVNLKVGSSRELAEVEKTAMNLIAAMSGESNVEEDSTAHRS
ncbi:hypothetical protein [Spirulina sp. 06S082]|uniref:hypothetical protein n=1 Tax=Spirulina sp. 06S082 TaxID=3110248 RepID=UPI002B20709C|nr:hypothetical protein [Spirulina sp. 06S082]MEA5472317.1 hypothetical protein [Spirulina sp. 06S082]